MKRSVQRILDGVVGKFGPDASLPFDGGGLPGHVKRGDRNFLVVDAVVEESGFDPWEPRSGRTPEYIAATTSESGLLLFDVNGVGSARRDGHRVSTLTYRSRGVVVGAPVRRLRSAKLYGVSAFFPGIGRWSAMSGSTEDRQTNGEGRLKSVSYRLEAAPEQSAKTGAGRTLTLTTHWETSGPEDRRVLYSPVSVSSTSKYPEDWSQHFKPLQAVQELVSLAYQGFVVADGGRAMVDTTGTAPDEHPVWWHTNFMERSPGAPEPRSMTDRPTFTLRDLGGIDGLRRWLTLRAAHPRATGPLVLPFTRGTHVVETRLTEVAAALEYWVAHQRRTRAWTKRGDNYAEAVALHVGKEFIRWVGDPSKWAKTFWSTYTGLKHIHDFKYDPYEVSLLADSGSILLQCALLNRVARTKAPETAICTSHSNRQLGEDVRSLVQP